MNDDLMRQVRRRARDTCEYCRLPQEARPAKFQVDHIIARQHRGATAPGNLALACLACNGHKGANIAGIDPVTRRITRLFHPRRHKWDWHFAWDGPYLVGRTAIGRTTVEVLAMNGPEMVAIREALIDAGEFPPR